MCRESRSLTIRFCDAQTQKRVAQAGAANVNCPGRDKRSFSSLYPTAREMKTRTSSISRASERVPRSAPAPRPASAKDRRINKCRMVAFRSAKAASFAERIATVISGPVLWAALLEKWAALTCAKVFRQRSGNPRFSRGFLRVGYFAWIKQYNQRTYKTGRSPRKEVDFGPFCSFVRRPPANGAEGRKGAEVRLRGILSLSKTAKAAPRHNESGNQ